MFEAVLAALADHGFTPTAIVTRLTYLSAPDSVQGALAAGLLGGGSRFLGVTEDTGRFLHDGAGRAVDGDLPSDDAAGTRWPWTTVRAERDNGRFVPGLGHHVHKDGDPRTPRLMQIAQRGGPVRPAPGACSWPSAGCTLRSSDRTLPLNGAGVCGAALADLGLPLELLRGFALLARTAGLIGQLAEELRRPVANEIFLSVDLNNAPSTPSHTVPIVQPDHEEVRDGRDGRRHRVHASPLLLRGQHRAPATSAAVRGRVGAQGRGVPGDADEGEPDVLVMVGSDHFHQLWLDNMPQFLVGHAEQYDANWYNEEREFGLPRMHMQGDRDLSGHMLRDGLDAGFDLAFCNELRIDHSVTCPIITLRPQNDLPIVPIYTNIFAPPLPQPKRFVELGRTIRRTGRVVAE